MDRKKPITAFLIVRSSCPYLLIVPTESHYVNYFRCCNILHHIRLLLVLIQAFTMRSALVTAHLQFLVLQQKQYFTILLTLPLAAAFPMVRSLILLPTMKTQMYALFTLLRYSTIASYETETQQVRPNTK